MGMLNGKLNIKKILFWLFYVYFAHSKGSAKQNAKIFSLPQILFLHISQKSQNQLGPLKK